MSLVLTTAMSAHKKEQTINFIILDLSLNSLSKIRILLLIAHVKGPENYDGCLGRSHEGAAEIAQRDHKDPSLHLQHHMKVWRGCTQL